MLALSRLRMFSVLAVMQVEQAVTQQPLHDLFLNLSIYYFLMTKSSSSTLAAAAASPRSSSAAASPI